MSDQRDSRDPDTWSIPLRPGDGSGQRGRRPGSANRTALKVAALIGGGAVIALGAVIAVNRWDGADQGPAGGGNAAGSPAGSSPATGGPSRGAGVGRKAGAGAGRTQRAGATAVRPTVRPSPVPTGASAGRWRAVTDGPLTFQVTKVEYGLADVGNGEGAQPLDGKRFTVVRLVVRNRSGRPVLLPHEAQRLVDARGGPHRPEVATEAGVAGNRLLIPVPASSSSRGVLVFALPAGARPARLTLKGSASSAGVTLAVG